ncbi:MAG: hypothetical protein HY028_10425 [Gammaproteobacteria bacterium]|nr:hypothetical protein [Gammaproteobacteria bacterium]
MKGPQILFENEDRLVTKMGGWFPGERVVIRGQDLHVDLADMDWMELYLYSITGRRFREAQLKALNGLWRTTSYPEPRLWNNRVCALAGTVRSTGVLAITAGMAVSEAGIYGRRASIRAIDFLVRTKKALDQGADLSECIKKELERYRGIYGYGRPVTREDERIPHLLNLIKEAGLEQGPYIRMVFEIERLLLEGRWRMNMNFSALASAIACEIDLSPREYYLFMIPCFVAGMLPCFIEASEKPEGSFFPLSCERLRHEGAPRRSWG